MRNNVCGWFYAVLMPPAPRVSTPVHDSRTLRALAHPVRYRILEELTATGPARAADLAEDLGIPANQASFHLRQLAKYGVVVEAPEEARDRRDRVWKVVADAGYTVNLRELQADANTRAASTVWQRMFEGRTHDAVSALFRDYRLDDGAVRNVSNDSVRLTADEARAMAQELNDVMSRWGDRTRGRDPERRSYLLMTILQPHPGTDTGEPPPERPVTPSTE